jgi:hypothetical protein
LVDERDPLQILRRDECEWEIAQGLESRRHGKGVDGEAVFEELYTDPEAQERDGHRCVGLPN